MKNLFLIFAIISLSISKLNAQTNTNHPTITSLKVSYKSVPQGTVNNLQNNTSQINVIPQSTINLVVAANVTKIYFKILNTQTNAVIYQVNYPINSSVILNTEGKKIFENNNGVIFISSGQITPLKPYTFQLQTEDDQSNLSAIYSAIH
jgi:hypothetical protein